MIKRVPLTGSWGLKFPAILLAFYGCAVFPAVHWGLRGIPWLPQIIYPAFFAASLLFVMTTGKVTFTQLGFNSRNLAQSFILGGIGGGLILAFPPLLDWFIDFSGLGQSEIFQGADHRLPPAAVKNIAPLPLLGILFIVPLLEQGFFNGFLLQPLIKKIKPAGAIYLVGLIFALAHFDFELGTFFIGLTSAGFFYWTGTLYASLVFQIACHVAGVLVLPYYPRAVTLLGFLF